VVHEVVRELVRERIILIKRNYCARLAGQFQCYPGLRYVELTLCSIDSRTPATPMSVSHDDLTELAAQLHAAGVEQAADRRSSWSALSLKAAATLRQIAEPNRQGGGLRDASRLARFRRWLWWVLNPGGPR
jgi:hypothetical protein